MQQQTPHVHVTGEEYANFELQTSSFNQFVTLVFFKRCIAKMLCNKNDLCLRLVDIEPSNYNPSLVEFIYKENGQILLQIVSPHRDKPVYPRYALPTDIHVVAKLEQRPIFSEMDLLYAAEKLQFYSGECSL